MDFTEVVINCPNLVTLVIQKENPRETIRTQKLAQKGVRGHHLPHLTTLEITNSYFPKEVFNFFLTSAPNLVTVKAYHVKHLTCEDVEGWEGHLQHLETLILFKAPEMTKEGVDEIIQILPKLRCLGNFGNFDVRTQELLKKMNTR